MDNSNAAALDRLIAIMEQLRSPGGCPWDLQQTFDTIAPYTIEEGYEVADAIARQSPAALLDELGDLLLQVVYHARMAQEAGHFTFADVAQSIGDKMVRRHPHVFGDAAPRDVMQQDRAWEEQKLLEREARQETRTLAGVACSLPSLTRAAKITKRAARVGFDWPDSEAVLEKLQEEIQELQAELPTGARHRMADELGDTLFVLANLARKLELDPESCLRDAIRKFERRFSGIEDRAAKAGAALADLSLEQMEELWRQVKQQEKVVQSSSKAPRTASQLP